MNMNVIKYQFLMRVLAVATLLILIGFSDYNEHMLLLFIIVFGYVVYNIFARLRIGIFKQNRVHIYNLFLDVTLLSVAIAVRGGLRSDFYLGFFLILGYVLLIKDKSLMLKLSAWIVINYSIFTIFFTEDDAFSYGRLIIRLTLLIGTTLTLQKYSKILIQSESLTEKALSAAMIDTLTGAYNRRMLDYLGEMFLSNDISVYVVMLDLDDFKHLNDTYGHQKGDEVLVAIAKQIQKTINDDSFCIRFGGDEFLLLIQSEDYETVKRMVQSIQYHLENMSFQWLKKEHKITLTAGIGYRKNNEPISEIIELADQALYEGKKIRKNRIEKNVL